MVFANISKLFPKAILLRYTPDFSIRQFSCSSLLPALFSVSFILITLEYMEPHWLHFYVCVVLKLSYSMYTVRHTNIRVSWLFTCAHTHKPLARSRYRQIHHPKRAVSCPFSCSTLQEITTFFFYHKFFYFVLVLQINRISLSYENHPCILCSNLFFLLFY